MSTDDTGELVNELVGAAEMASFCVPGVGDFLAGAIAGGLAVFNLVYDDSSAEATSTATSADIDAAVNDIKKAITDSAVQTKLDNIRDRIHDFNRSLALGWRDLKEENDFLMLRDIDSPLSQDWITHYQFVKEPILDTNSDFYHAMNVLAGLQPYKNPALYGFQRQIASLHIYTVNVFLLYAKLCLMWEYRDHISSDKDKASLRDFLKENIDNAELAKATVAWNKARVAAIQKAKAEGKTADEADIPPLPIDAMVDTQFYLHSVFVQAIKDGLLGLDDNPDVIGYLPALVSFRDFITERFDAFDKRMAKVEASVTVNSKFEILVDGKKIADGWDAETAKAMREAEIGKHRATIEQAEIIDYGTDAFDADYRAMLDKVIANWTYLRDDAIAFIDKYKNATGQTG